MPQWSCYCLRLPPVGPTNQRLGFWGVFGDNGIDSTLHHTKPPITSNFFCLELYSKASSTGLDSKASESLLIHRPRPSQVHNPRPGMYMQSTEQMWNALTTAVFAVKPAADETHLSVRGVGFDATSSLVLVGKDGKAIRYFIYRAPLKGIGQVW